MAVPLYMLYEITVWIAWYWDRRDKKRAAGKIYKTHFTNRQFRRRLKPTIKNVCETSHLCSLLAALGALFTAGCAGPEQRLGSGINNLTEFARLGEMRPSIEQNAVFDSPGAATPRV